MNLHQLRYVREAVRQNFNLTAVANALYTSQPGVSKAIIEFEDELGFQIFVRRGKRIIGLTPPGEMVIGSVERVLMEIENLRRIADDFAAQDHGTLVIATTATQARYTLPKVIAQFKEIFPGVRLKLLQGDPGHVAQYVMHGRADLGIATEVLSEQSELVTLPLFQWRHVVLVPREHALASVEHLHFEQVAAQPLITYEHTFSGRPKIDAAFARRGVEPQIVLEAIDSDVIKTYVELGLGIGIIAEMAYDPVRDSNLVALPAGHLFGENVLRMAIRQGSYLRDYAVKFLHLLSPQLTRARIESAMRKGTADDDSYGL
ncbi:CysB family HTH-type transcriptional regulator [Derxia gummosa]|uniref:CysB family HTH-type transcriptional regulator n=1 Tax=Derxia gummosa DSM 723 TaxID=1121388 RepID=A0A8B6X6G2_9BURK|nr:CysB family HTH-type transcriptional regulator [Derxia gummosa]